MAQLDELLVYLKDNDGSDLHLAAGLEPRILQIRSARGGRVGCLAYQRGQTPWITIDATPAAVWQAITEDIGQWWPSMFYCGSGAAGGQGKFLLEARPGGRMWEDHGDGDGLLWATIVNVVKHKTLEFTGSIGAAWGGPCTWIGGYSLEEVDGKTKLRFAESGFDSRFCRHESVSRADQPIRSSCTSLSRVCAACPSFRLLS